MTLGRAHCTGGQKRKTIAHLCIDGPSHLAQAKLIEVWRQLADASPTVIPESTIREDALIAAVARLYQGDTSASEAIVSGALRSSSEEADEHGSGWIFSLPFVPMTEKHIETALSIVRAEAAQSSIHVGTTINVLDYDTVDFVVALSFTRDRAQTRAAHELFDRLTVSLLRAGYMPYRISTHHTRADYVSNSTELDGMIADRIKYAFDPTGIIASNRYTLAPSPANLNSSISSARR